MGASCDARADASSLACFSPWASSRATRNFSVLGEVILALYFLAAIGFAIAEGYWIGIPFLLVFFNGFAYTALLSLIVALRGSFTGYFIAL